MSSEQACDRNVAAKVTIVERLDDEGLFVDPDARVADGAEVAAPGFIDSRATVEDGATVGARAVIGPGCRIGRDTVVEGGVKVIAPTNLASEMATHASQLYAKNVDNLLGLLVAEDGSLKLDFDDEIVAGACITHDGAIVSERAKEVARG